MAKKTTAKKTTKKTPSTYIGFVLDGSGSMGIVHTATIEAFNTYITSLKADDLGKVHFRLDAFETKDPLKYDGKLEDVIALTTHNYYPYGNTPLYDAVWEAMDAAESFVAGKEDCRVTIAIQTDGHENASTRIKNRTEYLGMIKERILRKEKEGWSFTFLGAGFDAYESATSMGIGAISTMSYSNDLVGTRNAFASVASATATFAKREAGSTFYTNHARGLVGDAFAANYVGSLTEDDIKKAANKVVPTDKT